MRDACSTALAAHGTIGLPCVAHVNLGTLGLVGPRAVNEALLDIRGERVKGLIDVDVALGRDFEERNAEFVCERLAPFCADGALLFPVALVTNEDLVNALGGVLLDVGKPCADVCCAELAEGKEVGRRRGKWIWAQRTVEASLVCHIVDEQDAHGAAVVGGSNGAETLLAGRVPYLQLDTLAVKLDGADLEVDADGGDEGRGEGVFAEAQQTARLADARVADEKQLDLWGLS
jgi:hypothetical protein